MIDLGLRKYMKQNFNIGEKVKLIHTDEIATVRKMANGMIYVDLEGDEIPVYSEDIISIGGGGNRPTDQSREFKPREENRPKEKVPMT